jgi:DNA-binding NtrC family response regulator
MSPKILIIDDELDVVEFQKSFLQRRKYEVVMAHSTAQALQAIDNESPDVIFCDMRLDHDRSGLEILAHSKKTKPSTAIFLVTGYVDKTIADEGLAMGAHEVLTKPVSNEILATKIQDALS